MTFNITTYVPDNYAGPDQFCNADIFNVEYIIITSGKNKYKIVPDKKYGIEIRKVTNESAIPRCRAIEEKMKSEDYWPPEPPDAAIEMVVDSILGLDSQIDDYSDATYLQLEHIAIEYVNSDKQEYADYIRMRVKQHQKQYESDF